MLGFTRSNQDCSDLERVKTLKKIFAWMDGLFITKTKYTFDSPPTGNISSVPWPERAQQQQQGGRDEGLVEGAGR